MKKFLFIFLFLARVAAAQTNYDAGSRAGIQSTTVDLTSVYTVVDDATNHAGVLLTATTKPGSPQYTKTITSGNIPSNTNVTDYEVYFSISGKNTNNATLTLNWRFTLNGTDIDLSDATLSVNATTFWWVTGLFATNAIAASDVLGIKMWCATASKMDYRDVSIYILPRKYAVTPANVITIYTKQSGATASGANSGVTYTSLTPNLATIVIQDGSGNTAVSTGFDGMVASSPLIFMPSNMVNINSSTTGTDGISQRLSSVQSIPTHFYQWKTF